MDELRRKIAQVVMVGFDGLTPSEEIKRLIKGGVGGIILYAKNCRNPSQVAELIRGLQEVSLCRGLRLPLLVAIDQEHGPVTRIREGITLFPSPWDLGRSGDIDVVGRVARITGKELALMGINMNLAPVADLLLHPQNRVIGKRSFGSDPQLVGGMVAAYIRELQREGVAACAKHFPGHGATPKDSHHELPIIERSREELERVELVPFHMAVRANVAAIMTGHLTYPALDPQVPATLSPAIIQGLLRQDLGFNEVLISDDLTMGALSRWGTLEERGIMALKAGIDLLLVGQGKVDGLLETLKRGVSTGNIPRGRAAEAICRIVRLKERYPYRGSEDLKRLRQREDLAFSQGLFRRVRDEQGNLGDREI